MHSLRLDLRIMVPIAKLLLMGILIVSSIKAASDASMRKALTLNDRQLPKLYFYSNESKICGSTQSQINHSCSRSKTSDSCPTWFICSHTRSGKCQCGPNYNDGIKCDENKMVSAVLNCYCVTKVNSETYFGLCFYNCERPVTDKEYQTIYHDVSNKSELNDYMCGHFNRIGIGCGECQPGTSPLVLSYNLSCVRCPIVTGIGGNLFSLGLCPSQCYTSLLFSLMSMSPLQGYMDLYCSVKRYPHQHLFA